MMLMDVGKVCEVTRLPPRAVGGSEHRTPSKSSPWTRHEHSWQIQDINGHRGRTGNAYTHCHIVPTNQSTAKSAPREPHFRRYNVSRRELGDTDVFVPKRA